MHEPRELRASRMARRLAAPAFAVVVGLALWGCSEDGQQPAGPNRQALGFALARGQEPMLDSALAVHRRHTMRLMGIPGVVGTAVGGSAGPLSAPIEIIQDL